MKKIGRHMFAKALPRGALAHHSDIWGVCDKQGAHLGTIVWNDRWHGYVFKPAELTQFDSSSLGSMQAFLKKNTAAHLSGGELPKAEDGA